MLSTKLTSHQKQSLQMLAKSEELAIVGEILCEKYMISWAATNLEDEAHRQHLYRMVHAIKAVLNEIGNLASSDDIDNFNKDGEQA